MGILDEARAVADELDAADRLLSLRDVTWTAEEEQELRDLRNAQQLRRVCRRLGVDEVSKESFRSQVAFLVEDLVVTEEKVTEKYVDVNGSHQEVSTHHCFVLGVSKGNPFAAAGTSPGSDLQVSGFRLRDRSDLVGILRENPKVLFERDAVLALLADGARVRHARRPY